MNLFRQKNSESLKQAYSELIGVLPEAIKEKIHKIYLAKYYPDPNELYRKLTQRKGEKIELPDKFYRKLKKDMPHEKMQEMGYARPQTRLNTEIEAEELGSTLLFKVPRHCRNYQELAEQ